MRHIRFASISALTAWALLSLVVAPACAQSLPDNRFCTFDAVVVGNASGTPIGGSPPGFDAVIRDVFSAPIAHRALILDFSATGVRLFEIQNSGSVANCAARTISRLTDAAGMVNIAARFGGYANANAVEVVMQGVLLGTVKARSTDIDGLDGRTGLGDFSIFSANFLDNPAAQETDFDLNGNTALGDFAIFSQEFLSPAVDVYCP